jgi:hypothetical protein
MISLKEEEQQNSMKYIFTESQVKKIIDNQITENNNLQEQDMVNDQKSAINAGTKSFLDAKKIMGVDLTDRIMKYQKSIGCEPTGHMMDCQGKLPQNDKKLWQSLINKNKPLYDKALDWFNRMLGLGPGSGY